jgi:heme exporter protein A
MTVVPAGRQKLLTGRIGRTALRAQLPGPAAFMRNQPLHGTWTAVISISRIVVRSVTRTFGATAALRGVDLELAAGSLVFLEGPNGAGKSTLLSVLGTVLRPTSGSVVYEPVGADVMEVRRHLGWLAHDSHCYRQLTARENVELAARIHGVPVDGVWDRVASRVAAESLAARAVGTLSRGQRQRVALARALVHSPSVLLLDEPWSGLDSASSKLLERVVLEERERGALVVVVSHEPGLADRLEARRVRLENGRVVS